MRIIAGTLKGRAILSPRGRATRPTAEKVREAFFSIVAPYVPGSCFLDLFAGGGGVGIEALSRGADRAVFVEQDPSALRTLAANIERLRLFEYAEIVRSDVEHFLQFLREGALPFDIVFADPPYSSEPPNSLLRSLSEGVILSPTGVVAIEYFSKKALPQEVGGLALRRTYRYGETALTFYERKS